MLVEFEKWQAALNDFIVVWIKDTQDFIIKSLAHRSVDICKKDGSGVGADGILVVKYSVTTPSLKELIVINADGSFAKTCGNGLRCVALSAQKNHLQKNNTPLEYCEFKLEDRIISCRYLIPSSVSNYSKMFVEINMGKIIFDEQIVEYQNLKNYVTNVISNFSPHIKTQLSQYNFCNIGNNHLVFCTDIPSLELIQTIGPAFQQFNNNEGINVHVFNVADSELYATDIEKAQKYLESDIIDLIVAYSWERGAGLTKACGSGACAIVSSAIKNKLCTSKNWIAVKMPGGLVYVKVISLDDDIMLVGDAHYVFSGTIEI